jgi:hypothetical protein
MPPIDSVVGGEHVFVGGERWSTDAVDRRLEKTMWWNGAPVLRLGSRRWPCVAGCAFTWSLKPVFGSLSGHLATAGSRRNSQRSSPS